MASTVVASSSIYAPLATVIPRKQLDVGVNSTCNSQLLRSASSVLFKTNNNLRADTQLQTRGVRRSRSRSNVVFNVISTDRPGSGWDAVEDHYPDTSEDEFSQRFKLPHVTDLFPAQAIRSTFCTKSSCPLPISPLDVMNRWEDLGKVFVHDDDRVLLKENTANCSLAILDYPINYKSQITQSQDLCVKRDGVNALNGIQSRDPTVKPQVVDQKITEKNSQIYELQSSETNSNQVDLKDTIKYANPTSSGAECLDSCCKFVHQWVARAGPRSKIYFEPKEVKAAIVTCGGLCPGLNDVIRQIVLTLDVYGVKSMLGITYGYRGFFEDALQPIVLTRQVVQNIHLNGGSLLGVSRGGANTSDIVDSLQKEGINMLFVLGGNGTHAGAHFIHEECRKRHMKVAVVGVPKTIDNDILLMDKTFGFDTAVEEAQKAINAAYIEATSAYNGIGVVKLMGRSSGFIAMHASLASGQVDICLIPEVSFTLDGPSGVLHYLRHLVEEKGRAVVCIAEGAGQDLLPKKTETDPSGNPVLADVGIYLQQQIKKHFKEANVPADVKYIDPTYMIRACKANASDSILCAVLGQNAVHGAFAGYSGITVGICNNHYVYLPIPEVISHARNVDPDSRMWHRCLTSTGQPDFLSHN